MALLGLLVLAYLFVSPATTATATTATAARATVPAGTAPAVTASTARGVAPRGIAQRELRDHLRELPRRAAPEHPRLAVAVGRPTAAGSGPTLFAAILGTPILFVLLVAGFLAVFHRTGQVSRRTPGTRRDRAPPALAFA